MSTNEILFGLGLVLVLAIGAQLLSRRLALPAIVLLLPAGFVAGIATDNVHPDALLGALSQPFVSIAVGVILFEAGAEAVVRRGRPGRTRSSRASSPWGSSSRASASRRPWRCSSTTWTAAWRS